MKDMNKLINTKGWQSKPNSLYNRYLKIKSDRVKKDASKLINEVLGEGIQDSQWFLNWLDSLNAESVRY